jgi:hypothetical protein
LHSGRRRDRGCLSDREEDPEQAVEEAEQIVQKISEQAQQ